MTRDECELKILEHMLFIYDIYKEYHGNTDYLTLGFIKNAISFWNRYYEDDEKYPIKFRIELGGEEHDDDGDQELAEADADSL